MDLGAETSASQQMEAEEEMEEMEDIEPPPASVPFSQLFACADRFDWFLMVVGSIAAAAHGTALVVYLHYFAKVIRVPQYQQEDQFHRFKEVRFRFVLLSFFLFFFFLDFN
jgi:ATP-binding cassette subfamily B (MDR/TAP) protein 1